MATWACTRCTYENSWDNATCEICPLGKRPSVAHGGVVAPPPQPGGGHAGGGHNPSVVSGHGYTPHPGTQPVPSGHGGMGIPAPMPYDPVHPENYVQPPPWNGHIYCSPEMHSIAAKHFVPIREWGFDQTKYRLVFRWAQDFADKQPKLLTIAPLDGTIENVATCTPDPTGACFTDVYTETPPDNRPQGADTEPFIFQRQDGSAALVQCWPAGCKNDWDSFTRTSYRNVADQFEGKVETQAVHDFAIAMERLWGNRNCNCFDGVSAKILDHIDYCRFETHNNNWLVCANRDSLVPFLTECAEARNHLHITSVEETGFTCQDMNGQNITKFVKMSDQHDLRYVVYVENEAGVKMTTAKEFSRWYNECKIHYPESWD